MRRGLRVGFRGLQVPGSPLLRGNGWRLGPLRAARLPGAPVLPGTGRVPRLHGLGRHLPRRGILPHDHRVLDRRWPRPLKEMHQQLKTTKVLEPFRKSSRSPNKVPTTSRVPEPFTAFSVPEDSRTSVRLPRTHQCCPRVNKSIYCPRW